MRQPHVKPIYFLLVLILCIGAIAFMLAFQRLYSLNPTLPIDLDTRPIQNWQIDYSTAELVNPPWSLLFLLPIGTLPDGAAWGMMGYMTVLAVLMHVPRVRRVGTYFLLISLALLGLPTLRSIIDANTEFMVPLGAILCLWGYRDMRPLLLALGVLIVTNKPQSSLFLVLVIGVYMLQTWEPRRWLQAAGWVLLVVVPTLVLVGDAWLDVMFGIPTQSSIMDSSLISSLNRTEMIPSVVTNGLRLLITVGTLWLAWFSTRTLSPQKAAFLIAAGLLVAPYAAGNSALGIYAVGVIPLLLVNRRLGVLLVIGANLLYLAFLSGQSAWLFQYSGYYWTGYFLASWSLLGWYVWRNEILTNP